MCRGIMVLTWAFVWYGAIVFSGQRYIQFWQVVRHLPDIEAKSTSGVYSAQDSFFFPGRKIFFFFPHLVFSLIRDKNGNMFSVGRYYLLYAFFLPHLHIFLGFFPQGEKNNVFSNLLSSSFFTLIWLSRD